MDVAHTPATAAGGSLTGHTANDILIDFTGTLGGQQLLITLEKGSIYQDPFGGNSPPAEGLISIYPDLEFDSFFALGGLTAATSAAPALAGGANAVGGAGMAAFNTSTANQTWFPPGGTFITDATDYPIARITLSDDASGSWRLLSTTSTGNGYIAAPEVDVPNAVMGATVDLGVGVAAIASDKSPLGYGQTATFANVSGYSRGINGLFLDVDGLPADGALLDAADFTIAAGVGNFPDTWGLVAPADIGVLPGQGENGSDRVFITFANGAISDTWLRVRLHANDNTLLAADEDFIFGAAPGDTGAGFISGGQGPREGDDSRNAAR